MSSTITWFILISNTILIVIFFLILKHLKIMIKTLQADAEALATFSADINRALNEIENARETPK